LPLAKFFVTTNLFNEVITLISTIDEYINQLSYFPIITFKVSHMFNHISVSLKRKVSHVAVEETLMPCKLNSFDIILSNQSILHVGSGITLPQQPG